MGPLFLVPELTTHGNGDGATIELPPPRPPAILITLGITKVIEQEALTVTIDGSPDGTTFFPTPIVSFPQKFYTGISTLLVDLAKHPDVICLRTRWKAIRWGRGDKTPSFTFYVFAEPTS